MVKTTANRKAAASGGPDTQRVISLQAIAAIAVASLFVSVIAVGRVSARAFVVFCASFAGMGGMWMVFRHFLHRHESTPALQRERDILLEIASLPNETARRQGERLLEDSQKFLCERDPVVSVPHGENLPPLLHELFREYRQVAVRNGDGVLNRETVASSRYIDGYQTVGKDIEGCDLIAERAQEIIFETDGTEESKDAMRQYPTVYHWLLAQDRFIYGK